MNKDTRLEEINYIRMENITPVPKEVAENQLK